MTPPTEAGQAVEAPTEIVTSDDTFVVATNLAWGEVFDEVGPPHRWALFNVLRDSRVIVGVIVAVAVCAVSVAATLVLTMGPLPGGGGWIGRENRGR